MGGRPTIGVMSVETRDDAVTEAFEKGLRAAGFVVERASQDGIDPEIQHVDLHVFRFSKVQL